MNSYPLPTLKQSIATRESVQLANLLKQYNVSSLRSLNNVDSAYVTRSTGTASDASVLSECQIWLDTFMLCVKSQTEKSTSCFRTNALKDMGKIILVQAPDSQTQDIQIFNHLTTLSSLPLPNRLVVSINIEIAKELSGKILATHVLSSCLSSIISESYTFASSVVERVFDNQIACI
jgi:hypothetical protein